MFAILAGVRRRLARSLVFEATGLWALGVVAVCLLLSIDLLSVLARFLLEQGASLRDVAVLLASKLPWFLHLSMPVAAIFAVLVAGGRMSKDSELKAAQAGGIAPRTLLGALLIWATALSIAATFVNGFVEPRAERRYQEIIEGFLYERPPSSTERNVSYYVDGTIFHAARIRTADASEGTASLDGVLIRFPDGSAWTARRGTWSSVDRTWALESGWAFSNDLLPSPRAPATVPIPIRIDASEGLGRAETRTLAELARDMRTAREAGRDVQPVRFEFHRRIADAISTWTFVLVAGALALRLRGRAAGVAWTIVLVASFWAVWTLTGSLYERQVLGALQAAWLTPALLCAFGAVLALRSGHA